MDQIENLAAAVIKAAKYREDSWDDDAGEHSLLLTDAIAQASVEAGLDHRTDDLLFMLLGSCWAEAIEWARSIIPS